MMKRLVLYVSLMVALMAMATGKASAIPYLDLNGDHTGGVWLSQSGDSNETWTFNLDTDALALGDIEAGDTILSALLTITIIDDEPLDILPWNLEFTNLTLDGTQVWNNVEVDAGIYIGNVIAWVSDHVLQVTLSNIQGDFGVAGMSLSGCYEPSCSNNQPVIPEPATISLIALGVAGLGCMGRRRLHRR